MRVFLFKGPKVTGSLSPFVPLVSFVSLRDWDLYFFPVCWDFRCRSGYRLAYRCVRSICFISCCTACAIGICLHRFWRFWVVLVLLVCVASLPG